MKRTFLNRLILASVMCAALCGMSACNQKQIDNNNMTQDVTAIELTDEEESTQVTTTQNVDTSDKENGTTQSAISLQQGNCWENGDMHCAQYEAIICNTSEDAQSDWKVVIKVPEGATVQDSWNGVFEIKGEQMTVTPMEYNKEVAAKGEVSFGFILGHKSSFELDQATLSLGDKTYALGDKISSSQSDENKEETEKADKENGMNKEQTLKKKEKSDKTAVAAHGGLSVKGTDLVDQNGKNFQLKGVSTHGLAWFPDYVNKDSFSSLSEYGVNAMRLAMYTAESGGYCNGGDKNKLEDLVDQGVEACTELGMYVIVDWHILSDNDPNQHKDEAKKFFDNVSKKYAQHNNVIYEICNEPCNGTTWEQVKSYAEEVIPVIRANDKNAIIIVGTPNWSQDVDVASENPIKGFDNIMYAVHFYASTHKEEIRNKVIKARENGLAVIVSECSICEASGNGTVNYEEAQKWMTLVNDNQMSIFAWNLSNKDEKSSLLKSSVSKKGDFSKDDFSETGVWFMEQYSK